ncbi:hypothetical protein J2Y45_002692 [Dyadobacter sp. BE34]|uniref:Lipocalin-like domain-containing protein n=1 Tax=Dyadobacter fermentans TaxID=94254 RepID=A0ABU1QXK3_9BACT|nr:MULTISPECIES: hypothetical protein [Dyadobacter]MDR6805000.1 hypothetical protein [Dyadobacter fermentans]MDR7043241.1 hypothetical protein [Dyadobacter sp. BE242]MDR7197553.1 hypothetical protein [Dyadobacter sp. BE34]MDR7215014.1 hypothetical protein [Dyadobacter sp. BE31]MDR7262549.1 hypothetical protein [Dyadobacter sp. BE32]
MQRLALLLLLLWAFSNCKRDKSAEPQPLPEVAGIVGKWHLVETRYTAGDSTVVKNMTNEPQKAFSIRFDGVMLYDGYGSCCATYEYEINGNVFKVKPQKDVPYDINCGLVDCFACPKLIITQAGDEMTIESCFGGIDRYVRKK